MHFVFFFCYYRIRQIRELIKTKKIREKIKLKQKAEKGKIESLAKIKCLKRKKIAMTRQIGEKN